MSTTDPASPEPPKEHWDWWGDLTLLVSYLLVPLVGAIVATRWIHRVNPEFFTTIAVVIPVFAVALTAEAVITGSHPSRSERRESVEIFVMMWALVALQEAIALVAVAVDSKSVVLLGVLLGMLLNTVIVVVYGSAERILPGKDVAADDAVDKPLTVATVEPDKTND